MHQDRKRTVQSAQTSTRCSLDNLINLVGEKMRNKMTEWPKKIFHVSGPGDAIAAHKSWKAAVHDPTEVSITFSSQVEQFAADIGAQIYIVSYHTRVEVHKDEIATIEHLPKPNPKARGLAYHIRELYYGLQLLSRARAFGADVAILDSGCTHYFWQSIFALFGIKVVPVLHNSLWPNGFRPKSAVSKFIFTLDRIFWRNVPLATLCVSPICQRQVTEIAGERCRPLLQIRAQFLEPYFEQIPPTPPHGKKPFSMIFVGRIVEEKGVFDVVEMAKKIEIQAPGRVHWTICGRGRDFDELKSRVVAAGLEDVVLLNGWTSLDDLAAIYGRSHAAIVPTRSTFTEGLAMTAAEAVLAGRPVITNPVVPALEILAPAAVEAKTNDPDSYVEMLLQLINNRSIYEEKVANCPKVSKDFVNRDLGLTAVLKRLFAPSAP